MKEKRQTIVEISHSKTEKPLLMAATAEAPLSKNYTPLLMAAGSGIVEIVEKIIDMYPEAVSHVSQDEYNVLHMAVKHRQLKIFNMIKKNAAFKSLIYRITSEGRTLLHQVSRMEFYKKQRLPGVTFQLQDELRWYATNKFEGIKLDCHEEVNWIDTAFEKMKKLRILIVRNTSISSGPIYLPNQLRLLDWKGYPSKSFLPGFYPKKIAALNLSCSPLVLEKPFQIFEHLTYMNFSYCQSITHFPNVSGAKNLRELILNCCKKLVKVDESVGFLPNLVYLSASECIQLRSFLPRICLPSLEYLSFNLCRRLGHFPDVVGKMDKPLRIRS